MQFEVLGPQNEGDAKAKRFAIGHDFGRRLPLDRQEGTA